MYPHAQLLVLPQEVAGVVPGIHADQQLPRLVSRGQQDVDAPLEELHRPVLAVLASGAQLVGDHEALAPGVAEDRRETLDIVVRLADALPVRRRVLKHGDVDVHGQKLHAARFNRREPRGGDLRNDARVNRLAPLVRMTGQAVQPLPERRLVGDGLPHQEAEEEVAAELGDVGVVAPAGRLDADEAPDYGRSRVARVACGGEEGVPQGHPAVAVKKLLYEGKAAVRVDFFGTLDKFIHDNLVG